MAHPVNPYIASAPLRGERGFFGRQDTLDWVARGLRNPATKALVLFGQRRIGKTALLLQLERRLPGNAFLPVYFDLQDQATRPLGSVLADLADTVARQIGLKPLDPTAFDDHGLFFSRTFLPQVYAILGKNRRPIFLLDEFDVLDEAAEAELPETAAAKALFRFTRRVMAKDPRPAFVFVVGRRTDDLDVDFTAAFKASLVREVWVLDRESAEALVRQAEAPDQTGTLRFTDRAVARILSLTSGHPYLTQLLCQQIWKQTHARNLAAPPLIDVPEVEAAVPSALEAGDEALDWLWNGLSLAEKTYAAALAEVVNEGEATSEDQGVQILTTHAARLLTQKVKLAPRDLMRRRVLEMTGEQEHRFAIELFRRWLRQYKPLRDVKEELDQVDPLATRLFDIGQEFSRRRQWETATRYFRDALEANPYHLHARLHLGEALLELAQTDEAVAQLKRAYELDQEEARLSLARALVAQARAREKAGDEDGALAACEWALRVSPNQQTAQKIRSAIRMRRLEVEAQSHERAERWTEAIAVYEQLATQAPDEEGRAVWNTALDRCRRERLLVRLFNEGRRALKRKNWQRAQGAFAEVVHSRPDYRINRQLAARLLLQAVLRKPVRKNMRVLAAALITVLVAVIGVLYFQPWKKIRLAPPVESQETAELPETVELPESWEHVSTYRLDTNRDGNQEWIVLYRFDLPAETEQDGGPIGGVVYQLDDRDPPVPIPYDLRPQGGDYLCECECSAAMEDVLSGLQGPELVVRNRCDDEMTRLSIFYWEPNEDEYLPKGHFRGSRIEVELDNVTVDQRLPHRAQLALRQVYHPYDNETYYQLSDQGILVMPERYELAFYQAEPEDVMRSPYPEKVVLTFYNHYNDEQISEYFTEKGWEQLEQCTAGLCGCTSARSEITHVRVTYLQLGEETYSEDKDLNPDRASVDFNVICERRNGAPESETSVRWYLVWQDNRWKMDNAEVILIKGN
ncbi:MAG: tetratricopeptide repeat protein [Anaerolineae bacterium]|nr:tetratricopeptide repeat protein [Anaerolineae bacterium]